MSFLIIRIYSTTKHSFQLRIFSILLLLFPLVISSIVEGAGNHDDISSSIDSRTIKPSQPPAPLLQGKGNNFLTLYLRLDPNDDATRTAKQQKDNIKEDRKTLLRYEYEIQYEDVMKRTSNDVNDESMIGLFLGQWRNFKIGTIRPNLKQSSSSYRFPVVVTIPNLSFDKLYR